MTRQIKPGDDLYVHLDGMLREVAFNLPDKFGPESRLREDLGLDSVAQMELVSVVDETLGLEVELEDVLHLQTLADVVALIERYLRDSQEA